MWWSWVIVEKHTLARYLSLYISYRISLFHECDLPNWTIYRICYHISNTTGATSEAGSAYPSGAPEITPSFRWGSCYLFFSFLCCVMCTIVCLFVFFIFIHGVVSLFSIYEFDCPSGIFRPFFVTHPHVKTVVSTKNWVDCWLSSFVTVFTLSYSFYIILNQGSVYIFPLKWHFIYRIITLQLL